MIVEYIPVLGAVISTNYEGCHLKIVQIPSYLSGIQFVSFP